jgi:hypothetical protein
VGSVLATEVTVMGMTMAAWQLGVIAGTVNAIIAGATGGNPLTAFAAGFIGGVAGGVWGVPGSIAAGAVGAVVQGGNPAMGAITAGVSVGVAAICQQTPLASIFDSIKDEFLKQLVVTTTSGALAGGVTAEMFGGNFGEGAASGLASSAATFAVFKAIGETYSNVDGFLVKRKDASAVKQALSNLKGKAPSMVKFLQDLANKGLKIDLYDEQNGCYDAKNNTVSWNPKFNDMFPNDPKAPSWSKTDPEVILGHELVHAYHRLVEGLPSKLPSGYIGWRHYVEYRAVGLGQFSGSNTVSENTLRQSYGSSQRTSYYKNGFPF